MEKVDIYNYERCDNSIDDLYVSYACDICLDDVLSEHIYNCENNKCSIRLCEKCLYKIYDRETRECSLPYIRCSFCRVPEGFKTCDVLNSAYYAKVKQEPKKEEKRQCPHMAAARFWRQLKEEDPEFVREFTEAMAAFEEDFANGTL